jgi:LCP family protein required for cell wall assembly
MINPQPVHRSRSPYGGGTQPIRSTQPQPTRPAPQAQLPKPLQPKASGPRKRRNRVIGSIVLLILAIGAVGGYLRYATLRDAIVVANSTQSAAVLDFNAENGISQLNPANFTTYGDGRITILVVGLDAAAGLTDSLQIISLDPIKNTASITSLPRDLYVSVPGQGSHKINATYRLAEDDEAGSGPKILKETVSKVIGVPVQHFVSINFAGVRDLVDAVGGIDVTVPEALYDPFFPAEVGDGYAPLFVKAGAQKMNGAQALRYARSRETTSDFDRSARQQIVIEAVRQKMFSAGVITNPAKLNNILTAASKNLKTDIPVASLKPIFEKYSAIPEGQRATYVLDTSEELNLLTSSTNPSTGYISYPVLGQTNFSAVHQWYAKNNPDPLVVSESPRVLIAPATSKVTKQQLDTLAATLTAQGYRPTVISTLPTNRSLQGSTKLMRNTDKTTPFSFNYLRSLLGTPGTDTGNPFQQETDMTIIYAPTTTSTNR